MVTAMREGATTFDLERDDRRIVTGDGVQPRRGCPSLRRRPQVVAARLMDGVPSACRGEAGTVWKPISDVFRRTLSVIGFSAAESPPISCHHPNLNNAAFPPVATVFHVTARSTANRGR